MAVLYDVQFPGEWGSRQTTSPVQSLDEMLTMSDGCKLFLRNWQTGSQNVLLIMHGLGAHSGWFIDMGNELAARGLTVYALDHRGFGHSEGLPGHVEHFATYVDDVAAVLQEIRKRHKGGATPTRFYVLGHSMGGIFATYLAAQQSDLLDGVLFLNPWVKDTASISPAMLLGVFGGGLLRARRRWRAPGGSDAMTTNPEAIKMLEADPYWRRDLTATFLLQIFLMRTRMLTQARQVRLPALVMQAEQDRSVVPDAARQLFETLASSDKTWKLYPDYAHDTQLEIERTQLDQDIVEWIQARFEPR